MSAVSAPFVRRLATQRRLEYNIKLQYPDLPLIDVGGQKQNLLPAELCTILDRQPFRGKLLDEHIASMITVALQPPNVNARAITERGLDELGFRQGPNPLAAFGVSIGTEMAVVPGRILQPPQLQYGQGTPRVDDRASWNLRDVKFAVGGRLEKWAVLLIQDGNQRDEFAGETDPELRHVVQGFMAMCRKSGMNVGRDEPAYAAVQLPRKEPSDPIRKKAIGAIRTRLMGITPKPSLVLVILSNGDKHIYSGLKHLCDVYLDVATVCVHAAKIRKEKGQPQYFANVALKVNMKMGGVNHSLDQRNMTWLMQSPTMLVGMDVTHPGFGTVSGTPSIAAVVASVDAKYGQFPAALRIQESKKEVGVFGGESLIPLLMALQMITDLASMMEERLNAFKAKSRVLPERIVVYRDGVSEVRHISPGLIRTHCVTQGQFAIVVAEEMPEIKKAFQKFSTPQKAYSPKLTIVICGKRHHTRFYPTDANNADNLGNPKAGTVVDRGVTAVYDFDFFLQAHGGVAHSTLASVQR